MVEFSGRVQWYSAVVECSDISDIIHILREVSDLSYKAFFGVKTLVVGSLMSQEPWSSLGTTRTEREKNPDDKLFISKLDKN